MSTSATSAAFGQANVPNVIALPIKLGWLRVLFLFLDSRSVYVLTVLMGVNAALAAFLFVRRIEGIGYWASSVLG